MKSKPDPSASAQEIAEILRYEYIHEQSPDSNYYAMKLHPEGRFVSYVDHLSAITAAVAAAEQEEKRDLELKEPASDNVNAVLQKALRKMSVDSHMWSMRPCDTCEVVSKAINQPFGCVYYRQQRRKSNSP